MAEARDPAEPRQQVSSPPSLRTRIRGLFLPRRNRHWPKPKGEPYQLVSYRESIERRLRFEDRVILSWWLTSIIPLIYMFFLGRANSDLADYTSSLDKNVVFPALAGVCSGIGAIVSIFLPLTLHQFNVTNPAPNEKPEEQFRQQWLHRLQRVTKLNVFMTILILLGTTVLAILSLGKFDTLAPGFRLNIDRYVTYAAMGFLVFGLTCFFLQLFTLGITEQGNLDRIGHRSLLQGVPWYSYIRSMLTIMGFEAAVSLILGAVVLPFLYIRFLDKSLEVVFDFCLIIWLPVLAATLYTHLTSRRYRKMWRERFLRKWGERAGLGLVCNFGLTKESPRVRAIEKSVVKILLNRQEQEPFRGMWLLPGGYINVQKGDKGLHETVHRRLKILAGIPEGEELFVVHGTEALASPVKESRTQVRGWLEKAVNHLNIDTQTRKGRVARLRCRLAEKLSQWSRKEVEDFSSKYSEAALLYSHAPTDTSLYLVTRVDGQALQENDIDISRKPNLRWWSLEEIETTFEIPAHLKELMLCVVAGEPSKLWRRGTLGTPNAS